MREVTAADVESCWMAAFNLFINAAAAAAVAVAVAGGEVEEAGEVAAASVGLLGAADAITDNLFKSNLPRSFAAKGLGALTADAPDASELPLSATGLLTGSSVTGGATFSGSRGVRMTEPVSGGVEIGSAPVFCNSRGVRMTGPVCDKGCLRGSKNYSQSAQAT